MNHIEFIEKNVREELMRQGFTKAVAQGGAYQAVDMYKRMSQASSSARGFVRPAQVSRLRRCRNTA